MASSFLRIVDARDPRAMARLTRTAERRDPVFEKQVRRILDGVRAGGDQALITFAKRFDDLGDDTLEISEQEMRMTAAATPLDVRRAIAQASRNIARVAFRQIPQHFDVTTAPGVTVEQRIEPLTRVGCYVPGGRFPLPSSLLMTAIPARVAGVRDVIAVCPRPEPAVMAAALEAGITRFFRVGGAQAIAALAYGTKSVPRVEKIVGPGNRWVAAAKAQIAGDLRDCAIDFYAGPTEIVVVAGDGDPDWAAADLVAQAEHDPDARSILITWRRAFAADVIKAAVRRSAKLSIAKTSLQRHGAVVITETPDEAVDVANALAPEHLVLERESLARRPIVAGSVFIGPYTAQALGDYAIGSNHVLPTAGAARVRGGLSAADFVRVMSVQRVTRPGLQNLAPTMLPLARAEGLSAHAESVEARLARRQRSSS